MSRFYFGGSDSDESLDENELPYPKPLPREAFVTDDFSAADFLSSLENRHQTLEDLRSELRSRSQELNKELLELVNNNYQEFLSLGGTLRGGDEKVEEVRLGLLSFQRDIDGLKGQVSERRREVENLVGERASISKEVKTGKLLLEVDQRLEELEETLRLEPNQEKETFDGDEGAQADEAETFTESDDSDSEDQTSSGLPIPRLRRRVQLFMLVKGLMEKIGPSHPFLLGQQDRVQRIRQTILLDLRSALAESRRAGEKSNGRTVKLLLLYKDMQEPHEALTVAKENKSKDL